VIGSVEYPLVGAAGTLDNDEHECGGGDHRHPHGAPASTASASARANPLGYRAR
jgi:hypothetical protein